jgi:hypothetical protein
MRSTVLSLALSLILCALRPAVSASTQKLPPADPHPQGLLLYDEAGKTQMKKLGKPPLALIGSEKSPMLTLRGSVAKIVKADAPIHLKPTGIKATVKRVYLRGRRGRTDLARPTMEGTIQGIRIAGSLNLTLTTNKIKNACIETDELGPVAVFFPYPMNFLDGIVFGLTPEQYDALRKRLGLGPEPAPAAPAEAAKPTGEPGKGK